MWHGWNPSKKHTLGRQTSLVRLPLSVFGALRGGLTRLSD
jgi:hypothetical protein